MTTFLITAPFTDDQLRELEDHGTVVYRPWIPLGRPHTDDELIALLEETSADVLIVELDPVTRRVLESSSVRIVGCCRAGVVNIDVEAARDRGVRVLRTPGRNAQAVAEYVLAMILMHLRNLAPSLEFVTSNDWQSGDRPYLRFRGHELRGRTVVFHGFGAVARHVHSLLTPFECTVLAIDPFVRSEDVPSGVRMVDAHEGYSAAQILSVHLPVLPDTIGAVGRDLLTLLSPEAIFVNSSRAAVVDYDALTELLESREIGGAVIDVYRAEPIGEADARLVTIPTVLATPHIAGATHEVVSHHSRIMTASVLSALGGEELSSAIAVV